MTKKKHCDTFFYKRIMMPLDTSAYILVIIIILAASLWVEHDFQYFTTWSVVANIAVYSTALFSLLFGNCSKFYITWVFPALGALCVVVAVNFTFIAHEYIDKLIESEKVDNFGGYHTYSVIVHYFPILFALTVPSLCKKVYITNQQKQHTLRTIREDETVGVLYTKTHCYSHGIVVGVYPLLLLMIYNCVFDITAVYSIEKKHKVYHALLASGCSIVYGILNCKISDFV